MNQTAIHITYLIESRPAEGMPWQRTGHTNTWTARSDAEHALNTRRQS
ncbi:hypothetical protein [Streptomyces tsukubensis]